MVVTHRPWLVLGIFCVGFFMALLDGSIVTVAIPTLIDDLDAGYDQVLWIVDAYLLVFSVLLITTGRLGDRYGYRRLYLVGVATFTGASALCGLAESAGWLLTARVLQGLGAAILFPQVISAIVAIFPPRQRGRAFGVFGAIVGVAPIVGPIVGGVLLDHVGWQWIFFVNVPVGMVTIGLVLAFVPEPGTWQAHRLDGVGIALVTAGLTGIVFGLIEGERYDWGTISGPVSVPAVIAAGVVLLVLFVGWQRVQRGEPLLPLALFRRDFAVGNWVGFTFQLGMIGIAFVLVIYLQSARGYSPTGTALIMLPMAVLTAVGSATAGRLADRFGGARVLLAGLAALALGLVVLAGTAGADAGAGQLMPGLVLIGLASGATFAPLQQATMAGVEPSLAGAASGVAGTTRQVGGVLGTAVAGAVLAGRLSSALWHEATTRAGQLPGTLRAEFVEATVAAGFAPPIVPRGLSTSDATMFAKLGQEAFAAGYVSALRFTLLAAAAVLLVAAGSCLAFREGR
jgi:EmrB/QacA subfamily drug resistance transporter